MTTADQDIATARDVAKKARTKALISIGWHLMLAAIPAALAFAARLTAQAGMIAPTIGLILSSFVACLILFRSTA